MASLPVALPFSCSESFLRARPAATRIPVALARRSPGRENVPRSRTSHRTKLQGACWCGDFRSVSKT
eukprot:5411028-Prymnesium_polylepis.1